MNIRELLLRDGRYPDQPVWVLILSRASMAQWPETWRMDDCIATDLEHVNEVLQQRVEPLQIVSNGRHTTAFVIERAPDAFASMREPIEQRPQDWQLPEPAHLTPEERTVWYMRQHGQWNPMARLEPLPKPEPEPEPEEEPEEEPEKAALDYLNNDLWNR